MKDFIAKHRDRIGGVLSGFDRIIFRGYVPIQTGASMAGLLTQRGTKVKGGSLKSYLTSHAEHVKDHAFQMAKAAGRPFTYLASGVPMEKQAREMAEAAGIKKGLVCVFSILEPCRTFAFPFDGGAASVRSARRKCLHMYYYFMDPDLGLIHVKIQTWFPMTVQVFANGQEWLARRLKRYGIGFGKVDNVFVHVDGVDRAQAIADRLASFDFVRFLDRYARIVNPLMCTELEALACYWTTAQAELATDVVFNDREALADLYPRLLRHALVSFDAKNVMTFLGRKLTGRFQGECVTDLVDLAHRRIPGARVKHMVGRNWIKMYDKAAVVLRVETVINNPEDSCVRKQVTRDGRQKTEWVQMRKGVSYLFRYRDGARSANSRYLDALSVVSDLSAEVLHRAHHPPRLPVFRTFRQGVQPALAG